MSKLWQKGEDCLFLLPLPPPPPPPESAFARDLLTSICSYLLLLTLIIGA